MWPHGVPKKMVLGKDAVTSHLRVKIVKSIYYPDDQFLAWQSGDGGVVT